MNEQAVTDLANEKGATDLILPVFSNWMMATGLSLTVCSKSDENNRPVST